MKKVGNLRRKKKRKKFRYIVEKICVFVDPNKWLKQTSNDDHTLDFHSS